MKEIKGGNGGELDIICRAINEAEDNQEFGVSQKQRQNLENEGEPWLCWVLLRGQDESREELQNLARWMPSVTPTQEQLQLEY